jgi:hypothetical protein
MKHRASRKFWQSYERLPAEIQRLADKNYQILKINPEHPSLHFKPVGRYWSVRVGMQYRALAIQSERDLVWFWIGTHSEYNAILRR